MVRVADDLVKLVPHPDDCPDDLPAHTLRRSFSRSENPSAELRGGILRYRGAESLR